MTTGMIQARGLVKSYAKTRALDGVDLSAGQGSVLALLGPNGAGKTTAVRVLTTLVTPDEGSVRLAGIDALAEPEQVRRNLGLSGQYAAVDEYLTGFENMVMIGRLYGLARSHARDRAEELLAHFSLTDAANKPSKDYSGGMRRRLDLAAALIIKSPVLILDEPTTGLDPRSRVETWQVIRKLVADGTTLLLTTQYLEEADRLADKITVIDRGRVIAEGTAAELKALVGGEHLRLTLANPADLPSATRILASITGAKVHADADAGTLTAPSPQGARTLTAVLLEYDTYQIRLLDLGLHRPTLDDVFLSLTGQPTRQTPEAEKPTSTESNR